MTKKLIQAALILLLSGGFCSAAVPVDLNDFINTSWVVNGKLRVSATHIGRQSTTGIMNINFDDGGIATFGDEGGTITTGDYFIDAKGKLAIDIHEEDIQSLFIDMVEQALNESGDSAYIESWWIDNVTASAKTKVTYRDDIVSLATTLSARAKVNVQVYGYPKTLHLGISFSFTSSGDHPIWEGSQTWASKWTVNTKIYESVKKIKSTVPVSLELTIGDYESPGLGINDFEIVEPNLTTLEKSIPGSFCRKKNKLYFQAGDFADISNLAEDIVRQNPNVDYFYITSWQGTLTATIIKQKIALSGTMHYRADIGYKDGTSASNVKGTFKMTGKGLQKPLIIE